MNQDDGNDPVARDNAVKAVVVLRDDDDDDDGDADGDGGSRQKRTQSREDPTHASATDDDEGDAISSLGHPPVLRLSAQVPLRRYSRLHLL